MSKETPGKISSLSIFFPAYNDGGTIPSMVLTAQIAARKITDDYEIIVVDDETSGPYPSGSHGIGKANSILACDPPS